MSDHCILFEHFVKLLHSISRVQPRRVDFPARCTNETPKSLELVDRWFMQARQYCSPHTSKIFFRLLFPEEDVRRKYDMKETTLARSLAIDVFGLSTGTHGAGHTLTQWSEYPNSFGKAKLGCLGTEVEKVLSARHSTRQGQSPSIQRIDDLLDELADLSRYSDLHTSVLHQKRPRAAVLRDLFLDLEPMEAKFLTQIILKDLRPVLYPLTETHTTRALLHHKSNAVHMLTKWEVMKAWNPYMPRVYRARATLDEAASAIETLSVTSHAHCDHEAFSPVLGVPIEIPKSQKGVRLSHALNIFRNQDHGDVWAETKYDGERMQIHIDLTLPSSHQIMIFSKSKRNSTLDRIGTHPIIRAALNLPPLPEDYLLYPALKYRVNKGSVCPVLTSVVLDAEMVCYSEFKGEIDEFWRLRSLIESTAYGVRGSRRQTIKLVSASQENRESGTEESPDVTMESLQSNASDNGDRHFKLIFFDLLSLNGSSLLDRDYISRRAQLEHLITQIPGYVSLSSRQRISMSGGFYAAVKILARVFSEHIANHQEGVVLKAAKSRYNDPRLPWVKLKRDYIPGYGDTVDLVILGAGWNKNRARELRVSPETFTSFFVAALENPVPTSDLAHCTPQFQVLFIAEYGMNREQLETFNMYIKSSGAHAFSDNIPGLPYTFKLPQRLAKPAFMFSRPLLTELFGAGFTKDLGMRYYSLRFPRITKVWWTNERNWTEGSHLEEFQRISRSSIGHESSEEWANRTVEAMWGSDVDLGPKDPRKVAETSNEWHQKLLKLEMSHVNEVDRTSGAGNNRARNTSSRRKAPPTGVTGPPTKRQKVQTCRIPKQSLMTLGSMTNFMHADVSAQDQMPSDTNESSMTPSVLKNNHHVQPDDLEDEGVDRKAIQCEPIHSASAEGTNRPMILPANPPHIAPTSPLRPSSIPPLLPTTMNMNKGLDANLLAHTAPPISPATSRQSISSDTEYPHDRMCASARFSVPYWPQQYIHTPVVQFLQDAYVWIPRESNNTRPTNRPSAFELVPQNRRIGVMYFLLIICGCRTSDMQRTTEQFAHVDKCVIFVNTGRDSNVQKGLSWTFDALESWREELNKPGNKELFVFDSNMITHDSLATFQGDVVSQALWRSSRELDGLKR